MFHVVWLRTQQDLDGTKCIAQNIGSFTSQIANNSAICWPHVYSHLQQMNDQMLLLPLIIIIVIKNNNNNNASE